MKIHPSAVVDSRAELDASVEVGPFCTIGPNVKIGKGTKLLSHAVLDGWTTIGENNTIFPFSYLGAVPQDLKYKGERTELIIGNNNTIRESVTMNLGTIHAGGKTVVGNDNYGGLAGHVTLEDYATLGGLSGVSQFVRIGAHSYIGGNSGLDRDVPPYVIAMGSRPCAIKGTNIVGLRRRGVSADVIQKINEAVKLWMRPEVQKEQCLLEIESQYGELAEIQNFVKFIRASETGIAK
jgi:UDP-N-acetylglucosamine acyltransferase